MGLLFSVYSQEAYKEYILPPLHNGEEKLILKKGLFGLREDVTIRLEAINGVWRFTEANAAIKMNGTSCLGREIGSKDSVEIITEAGECLYAISQIRESFFEIYDKYRLVGREQITIGSGTDMDICYSFIYGDKAYVSERHAVLHRMGDGWSLEGRGPNGTFLNNRCVNGMQCLAFGDHVNIWGVDIVFLGNVLGVSRGVGSAVSSKLEKWAAKGQKGNRHSERKISALKNTNTYHRSPRNIEPLVTETIEIEGPPAPREENDTPLFMQIGPALTMMLPMILGSGMAVFSSRITGGASSGVMYTGLITAVCSGGIGAFWAINNIKYAEKRRKKEETRRFDAYSQYLIKCAEKIKKAYEHNRQVLLERYPSAGEIIGEKDKVPDQLWGRNFNHEDFLYHRLGIGDIPFQAAIVVPKERFSLIQDSLGEKPGILKENYRILHSVPVGIDLMKHHLVGIAGGENKRGADPILYNLIAQIATQNCYTDVKLVFLSDSGDFEERWKFALWLPHVWSENRKFRFAAYDQIDAGEVLFELTEVFRRRFEEQREGINQDNQKMPLPYYILFVEDERLIAGELIEKYVYAREKKLGLTTVFLAERYEDLPNNCEYIIQNDEKFSGFCYAKAGTAGKLPVQFDIITKEQMDALARKISPLKVNEREIGGEIPNAITFFELYGVSFPEEFKAAERWRKNRIFESMKVLIGVKSGGEPCYLDLHEKYHGPHGLVAGTTGSGKSETLQTYILSLALNFSPDDVGFFIIDYKGGGMGNLFSNLPHVLGQISNLSGNQIRRAMVSIKSENLRRQRLFNENGVNSINHYTSLYKSGEAKVPIPHLFIIIDEFAELKREEPEFMRELISVAQVGRSLGVHLILATQKPAGTVDDNIWSNAKFHLCLRVQDRQDSMDMLHKPDAAYLVGAGRGYLQVGNDELYEMFQSGWSGAEYDEDAGAGGQVLASMLTASGKTAVVGNHEKSQRKAVARIKWLAGLIREWECVSETSGGYVERQEITEKTEEQLIEKWQKQLAAIGEDHLDSEYGRRLLKNLLILYEEVRKEGRGGDIRWIAERAQQKRWKLPEQKKRTQLEAVTDYLSRVAKEEGYGGQQPLWLPVLPSQLGLKRICETVTEQFNGTSWPEYTGKIVLRAEAGLCDDPANQVQEPLILNFTEDGNHAVCGLPMSGKSTFLQTVVYSLLKKYSPCYLNVYILDFSSRMLEPFERAPQVGGILYENDLDKIGKFFYMLGRMLKERKEVFRGGNYIQYVNKHGITYPAVVVVIDHAAAFREKTDYKYDDILLKLSRECAANGIYLLISGASYGMTEIPSRMKDNIRRNICLELQDKYQYADIFNTIKIDTLPEPGIAGRGLVKTEEGILEFQTCLVSEAQDDYGRLEEIGAECIRMEQSWTGKRARPIPVIPDRPVWSKFQEWDEAKPIFEDRTKLPIGYAYESAEPYCISLNSIYCCMISGKARTGKTNLLRIMMRGAALKKAEIMVIEFSGDELKNDAKELGAVYISSNDEYCDQMLRLIPEFQERYREKKSLHIKGMDDEDIFVQMSTKKPYFIFIADLVEFSQIMHGKEGRDRGFADLTANIFEKGSQLNIYFTACFNPDKRIDVQGQQVYRTFTDYKTGIHLGGNWEGQTYLDFPGFSLSQMKAPEPAGWGYASMPEKEGTMKIVVPLARG